MAAIRSKGSIILEIAIVLVALLLIAVIIIPNQIWQEEAKVTHACQENINKIYEAERFFYRTNESYTDTLSKLLTFVQNDSGLQQRQSLVSLTRSFIQFVDNILAVPSISEISTFSQAAFEITGDLRGAERYFRKFEDISALASEIEREIIQLDSSAVVPNFSKLKLYVDSLRGMRGSISDFSLQNGVLNALNYTDSINYYFPIYEKDILRSAWQQENEKILNLISMIKQSDIVNVSSVHDRIQKFIDRINNSMNKLLAADAGDDQDHISTERANLAELHQKYVSPEFFMLTKRYGLNSLIEEDSMLIEFTEENFTCPDNGERYLINIDSTKISVECPNLLTQIQEELLAVVEPVKELPHTSAMAQIDSAIKETRNVMDENRPLVRRNTDIVLSVKELDAEMNELVNVFFYRYTKDYQKLINTLENNKSLSKIKPAIEDMLNPIDTLATRINTGNIRDLEEKITYFNSGLQNLDSLIENSRLSSSAKRRMKSYAEPFQPAVAALDQIRSSFSEEFATKLNESGQMLEEKLLAALEGVDVPVHVIFAKTHSNHGSILNGEKSWEQE